MKGAFKAALQESMRRTVQQRLLVELQHRRDHGVLPYPMAY
jgi:hypothetical protein